MRQMALGVDRGVTCRGPGASGDCGVETVDDLRATEATVVRYAPPVLTRRVGSDDSDEALAS